MLYFITIDAIKQNKNNHIKNNTEYQLHIDC
jgi:hypothetical protein